MTYRVPLTVASVLFVPILLTLGCSSGSATDGGTPACDPPCSADDRCDQGSGRCVALPACETEVDCAPNASCLDGVCSSCDANIHCLGAYRACDPERGSCALCTSDADCPVGAPFCGSYGCGECAEDSDCPADRAECYQGFCYACTEHADCPGGWCTLQGLCRTACTTDAECPAEAPHCNVPAESCQPCVEDAHCSDGRFCFFGMCRVPGPGQTCEEAQLLTVAEGLTRARVSTRTYVADGLGGTRAFLKLRLPEAGALAVRIDPDPMTPQHEAAAEIAAACTFDAPVMAAREVPGGDLVMPSRHLPAGEYLLKLDAWPYLVVDVELRFQGEATPERGATCERPIELTLGPDGTATWEGPLGEGAVSALVCETAWPSVAHAIDMPRGGEIRATATPLSEGLEVGLQGRSDCLDATRDASASCGSGYSEVARETVTVDAGRYYLLTVGQAGQGTYRLDVEASFAPENDACADATVLLEGVETSTATADHAYATQDGCAGGRDSWYRFSTVGLGVRDLAVTVDTLGGSWPSRILLQQGCEVCPADAAYDSTLDSFSFPSLPEGDWLLRLIGTGEYSVDASLTVPHSLCPNARVLDLRSGPASVSGDSTGATDDAPWCDASTAGAGDVYYGLRGPGAGAFEAVVTPAAADFDPRLLVGPGCGFTGAACMDAAGAGTPERLLVPTTNGRAVLAVDGSGAEGGAFQLEARFIPPPANDLCSGAIPVTLGTFTGDLTSATASTESCTAGWLPNAYYRFVKTKTGFSTVRVVPHGFDAAVWVQNGCTVSPICVVGADAGGVGAEEVLTWSGARDTEWTIVVAAAEGRGSFDLIVE